MSDGSWPRGRSWSGRVRLAGLGALAGLGVAVAGCGGSDDEPADEPPAVEAGTSGVAGAEPDAGPTEDSGERDEPEAKRDAPGSDDGSDDADGRSEGDGSNGTNGSGGRGTNGSGGGTGKGVLGIPGKLKPVAPGSDQCELTLKGETATIPCDVGRRLLGLDEPR